MVLIPSTAALFAAIAQGDAAAARQLIETGTGQEAAEFGVACADIHILSALDAAGLPWRAPFVTGDDPEAPIPLADALFAHAIETATTPDIVRFLASRGADTGRIFGGRPPLLRFVQRSVNVDLEILDVLLTLGIPVDAANLHGETALMIAAGRGWENAAVVCERLLAVGADPSRRDAGGRTAVEWATAAPAFAALAVLRRFHGSAPIPAPRVLDPVPEALGAPAGSYWVLAATGTPPCLAWERTAATAAEAQAHVEERFGWSRARVGPFPVAWLVDVGNAKPVADPCAAQVACEVRPGDLLSLALLGVELPRTGEAPDPRGPIPRLVIAARFAGTEPTAALAHARRARGWSAVVCVESLPEMMDGYPYPLDSWRIEAMP